MNQIISYLLIPIIIFIYYLLKDKFPSLFNPLYSINFFFPAPLDQNEPSLKCVTGEEKNLTKLKNYEKYTYF